MENDPPIRECRNCDAFLEFADELGQCRRYPPRIVADDPSVLDHTDLESVWFQTYWPVVSTGEWCSEWTPQTAWQEIDLGADDPAGEEGGGDG